MTRYGLLCVCVALVVTGVVTGCGNSGDTGGPETPDVLPPPTDDGFMPGVTEADDDSAPSRTPDAQTPSTSPQAVLPTDEREPVVRDVPPPPISGGTLIIARDGRTAIAADPDRDRVVFVDLANAKVLGQVTLDSGAEPGRLTEDADGRVHVALRGSGKLASIDIASRELLSERAVCGSPRGVAYDAGTDALHVACLQGDLVTLSAGDGEEQRRLQLGTDLRDVVLTGDRVRVSRFKSAELLELDAEGEPLRTHALRDVDQLSFDPLDGSQRTRSFSPTLARRAIALGEDSTLVLHERAMNDAIELEDPHAASDDSAGEVLIDPGLVGAESSYGSAGGCTSIVQTAVSVVDAEGAVRHSFSLAGATLPVDVAVSPDKRMVAVADAGRRDPNAPSRVDSFGTGFATPAGFPPSPMGFTGDPRFASGIGGGVSVFSLVDGTAMTDSDMMIDTCTFGEVPVDGQPVAVAFAPDGGLVVLSREPAQLQILSSVAPRTIDLGGGTRLDTGHDIFHRDAGASIACASCHGEGGDDGHVWNFTTLGPRRTQSINVGLEGTEPFHWSGDMADLPMLVSEVFVGRMGGVNQSVARVDALAGWMFEQRAPRSLRASDDPAAERGKHLFESDEVACASCHSGSVLTNNKTVDVGTGEPLQVPSLVGIAYRAPFIHTGCAQTLRDRFDPECGGGDKHGKTSQLDDAQLDDLVAYLETL
jgi:mono/diheme cytochrome c family protein